MKYVVYDVDGDRVAHLESTEPKDNEKKLGEVDAANADDAVKQFAKQEKTTTKKHATTRPEPTEETKEKDLEVARKEEEKKQQFRVVSDSKGNFFVEGSKAHKANRRAGKEDDDDETEVWSGLAKDEDEALGRAKGTFHDPAEGAQRGSQTP